jgi:hypothetical protein
MMITDRTFELKQQVAHRQILALTVVGGSMLVLFGTLFTLLYLG